MHTYISQSTYLFIKNLVVLRGECSEILQIGCDEKVHIVTDICETWNVMSQFVVMEYFFCSILPSTKL